MADASTTATTTTDAGAACRSSADCPLGTCYFDAPGCPTSAGRCGPPAPSCYVSRPFCDCAGKTFFTCPPPSTPWAHAGACE